MAQWLRVGASTTQGTGSIPGSWLRSHVSRRMAKTITTQQNIEWPGCIQWPYRPIAHLKFKHLWTSHLGSSLSQRSWVAQIGILKWIYILHFHCLSQRKGPVTSVILLDSRFWLKFCPQSAFPVVWLNPGVQLKVCWTLCGWALGGHGFQSCSVTRSCPTLCDPRDWSPPGSSVHGILQEWGGLPSPPPGDLPNRI